MIGFTGKDKVTGFEGLITAECTYISGRKSYLIEARVNDKSETREEWVDVERLAVTSDSEVYGQL